MSYHLSKEIESLKKKILSLSAIVELNLYQAVQSIEKLDPVIAQRVIDKDREIDLFEIEVEEDCLKILALHQPVAIDLRLIVAFLKINNDLERIGDLAVNIAKRCIHIKKQVSVAENTFEFSHMAIMVQDMLKKSLDALVNLDPLLAKQVCLEDDKIDELNKKTYDAVKQAIAANPEKINSLIHFMFVSRNLERIADHATNISEDVIYMIDGEIVRHKKK